MINHLKINQQIFASLCFVYEHMLTFSDTFLFLDLPQSECFSTSQKDLLLPDNL